MSNNASGEGQQGERKAWTLTPDDKLPCDVRLPPATTINKGVSVGTLLASLEQRVLWGDGYDGRFPEKATQQQGGQQQGGQAKAWTTQQVADAFAFLEGVVSEAMYKQIVGTAYNFTAPQTPDGYVLVKVSELKPIIDYAMQGVHPFHTEARPALRKIHAMIAASEASG